MFYSIDYYSFTIPTEKPFKELMFNNEQAQVLKTFVSILPFLTPSLSELSQYTVEKGARFYNHRMRHTSTEIAISWGETNSHVLVELAGKACNNFDAIDALLPLIRATHQRCSRIDFATDIKTDIDPTVFIASRSNKSFKSSGSKRSPTGRTEYVGGRTSERVARVYRYNKPHPRSDFLRVEAEYKGDAAKASAKYLAETDVREACLGAHKPFGWQHETWTDSLESVAKIPYSSYKPADASTVRWLYGDVITALRKLSRRN